MKTSNKILTLLVMMITCVSVRVAACDLKQLNPPNPENLTNSKETVPEYREFKNFLAFIEFCEQYKIMLCDFKKQCAKNSSVGKNQLASQMSGQASGGQSSNNSSQPNIKFNLNLKPHQQILKKTDDDNMFKYCSKKNWVDKNGNTYMFFPANRPKK